MEQDLQALQARWWVLTIRGIIAILFGIAAVFWPGMTTITLVYLFGAWILVDGIVRIIGGIGSLGKHQLGFLTIVIGLLELGLGVYLIRHPSVTAITLLLLIAFMLIVGGVVEVVASLSSREGATAKTLEVIVGVSAVLAGILLLFQPRSAAGFVWIIGLYALIAGPMMVAMSLEIKKMTFTPASENGALLVDKRVK